MNRAEASKYFYIGGVEENVPYIIVLDPKQKIVAHGSQKSMEIGAYPYKKSDYLFLGTSIEDISKTLAAHFESEPTQILQTKRMHNITPVRKLSKDQFYAEVLNNEKISQCVIQIYKHK